MTNFEISKNFKTAGSEKRPLQTETPMRSFIVVGTAQFEAIIPEHDHSPF